MEDLIFLSRLQFAVTTVYHFLFVPLTLGLSVMLATFETLAYRTDEEEYRRIARFWGKLFLINFAVGVVTGIVQEFQFGMNWSEYSRFVGDIFGAPLAIEALLAFFLESTFLGIWIFGRDKIPAKLHVASIWVVAIGSNLSALWILIANSFMQNPVGFAFRNGRAEMTDFFALITNPYLFHQFPHVFFSGLATAAFFVMGISAWRIAVGAKDTPLFIRSFRIGLIFAVFSSMTVIFTGHTQAAGLAETQPMKLAAMEALYETQDPAPLSMLAWVDEENGKKTFSLEVPSVLSLLVYNEPRGLVRGINELQTEFIAQYGNGKYNPPVMLTFYAFRAMVGAGFLMVALSAFGVVWVLFRGHSMPKWLWSVFALAMVLPYIANSTGWILAETGRQPWVVYGLMKTEFGVSAGVTAGQVLFSLSAFTLLYGLLAGIMVFLIRKEAREGMPEEIED
jgi:cytochrome bd ubiquinol oxidase subunit I